MKRSSRTIVAAAIAWACLPAVGMAGQDVIIDLGTLGGAESSASDINGQGQVTGWAQNAVGEYLAFIWDEATGMVALPTLGGGDDWGRVINDAGQVAGYSWTMSGEQHACLWDPIAGIIDIGTLGGTWSDVNDMNALGQVVGRSRNALGEWHAYFWDTAAPGMVDLGVFAGQASINNLGQVVLSYYADASGPARVVVWDSVSGFVDIGSLNPGAATSAAGINNLGEVAGTSGGKGFIWDSANGMVEIPTPGDFSVRGISEAGHVIGTLYPSPLSCGIWDATNGLRVIPSSSGVPGQGARQCNDVNSLGQATGYDWTELGFAWGDKSLTVALSGIGGSYAQGFVLNDQGIIAGEGTESDITYNFHAIVWIPGKLR